MNGNLRSYAVVVILVVLCLFHLLVSLMMSVVVFFWAEWVLLCCTLSLESFGVRLLTFLPLEGVVIWFCCKMTFTSL